MGKLITKTNILVAIIIGLAVLNITIVSSIVWHKYHGFHDRGYREMPFNRGRLDVLIPQKLNFDDTQKERFRHIDTIFRQSSMNIIKRLHEERFKILLELKKTEVDTAKLFFYSREIGNLHSTLKMSTIEFYLDIKKICNPVQQDSLSAFFLNIIEFGDMPGPPFRRHDHRMEMPPK